MRLLLIGANGQVGYSLHRSLVGLGEIIATTRDGRLPGSNAPCEVADLDHPASLKALVERTAPDIVINAAAYTAVDRAENEREAVFRVNAESVASLAHECKHRGIRFVHYSTDYVFPGNSSTPWREDDQTQPLGVYGESKLAGEKAIRDSGCQHLIFRITWIYAARGNNFLRTMLRLGAGRDELAVVSDQTGSPTPASWIAQATAMVIPRSGSHCGTWHLAAGGDVSWHGFAEAIFAEALTAGLISRSPQVAKIATPDYPTSALRPAYSKLDTSRLLNDFGVSLPHWRVGLAETILDLARERYVEPPPRLPV